MPEFFFSPVFWVAVNAMIAVAIIQMVRALRRTRTETEVTKDRFAEVKALLQSGGAGREYVTDLGRTFIMALRRDESLGLKSTMTFRETVSLLSAKLGTEGSFDDLIRTFEATRYGGLAPAAEEVKAFKLRVRELIELLELSHSQAPDGPQR